MGVQVIPVPPVVWPVVDTCEDILCKPEDHDRLVDTALQSPCPLDTPRPSKAYSFSHGGKLANVINEGVKWETWLVGLQHRLLLGVAPIATHDNPSQVSGLAQDDAASCSSVNSLGVGKKRPRTEMSGSGERISAAVLLLEKPLYRLIAECTSLAERACFHSAFFSRPYLTRLGISFAFCWVCAYINAVATMVAGYRTPRTLLLDLQGNPLDKHTLPDLGHDLWAMVLTKLGHHTDYIDEHALPDRLVIALAKFTMVFMLLHPRRFMIFRRAFLICGLLMLMRAVSVTVTVLPDASPVCHAQFTSDSGRYKTQAMFPKVFIRALSFLFSPRQVTCGDMIFSGHTTCLMIFAMIFRKYCRAKHLQTRVFFKEQQITEAWCTGLRWAVYLYALSGCCIIIGSKLHYTLDVLLAIFLSTWAFRTYHHWVSYAMLRKKVWILRWLEAQEVLGLDEQAYEAAKSM